MNRRSFLRAGTAGAVATALPRFSIGQPANARVLRFVPQANLTVLETMLDSIHYIASHCVLAGSHQQSTLARCAAALQIAPNNPREEEFAR